MTYRTLKEMLDLLTDEQTEMYPVTDLVTTGDYVDILDEFHPVLVSEF
jgi:hypothetical protein